MIPALFTSTSSGPSRSSAASRKAEKEAVSVTSSRRPAARSPRPAAVAVAWASSRSPMATRAPRRTSSVAIAAPIPRAPPVTATVRPASGWAGADALTARESTEAFARA